MRSLRHEANSAIQPVNRRARTTLSPVCRIYLRCACHPASGNRGKDPGWRTRDEGPAGAANSSHPLFAQFINQITGC